MKNSIIIVIFLSFFLSCQENEKKEKVPYKEGDKYEFEGKEYTVKGGSYLMVQLNLSYLI